MKKCVIPLSEPLDDPGPRLKWFKEVDVFRGRGSIVTVLCLLLSIGHYLLSLWAGLLDGMSCSYRSDVCKSLLVSQHLTIHVEESIKKISNEFMPYCSVLQILSVILEWFVRWEVSDCTAIVLWHVDYRVCLKRHASSFSSSHLTFSFKYFCKSDPKHLYFSH